MVPKGNTKGMAHAFKIRFWETFSTTGTYDILTENQCKLPNSNDGCMQLRAPTACPEWTEGTEDMMKKSSTGSAKMLGLPLSVLQR